MAPRATSVDRRQRQKPSGLIGILAAPPQAAKISRIKVATQWHRHRHAEPPWFATLSQTFAVLGILRVTPNES